MNRYSLLAAIMCGIGSWVFAEVGMRPNIVHIIADDVGYDDLSCYGATDIKTPNLDRLAATGMTFTDFYAPHPTCTPSRAAILTGRYASRMNDGKGLSILWPGTEDGLDPEKEICLAKILKEQGYATALVGKWHLGDLPEYLPLKHGFDEYFGIPHPNDHGPERDGNTGSKGWGTRWLNGWTTMRSRRCRDGLCARSVDLFAARPKAESRSICSIQTSKPIRHGLYQRDLRGSRRPGHMATPSNIWIVPSESSWDS